MQLYKKLLFGLSNLITDFINTLQINQRILISYSGGLDSTVLLYQLIPYMKKYPFLKLRAIHINHQKNQYASIWSKHCKKNCIKHNIEIIIEKINTNIDQNFQEIARNLRYKIIKKHILAQEILVTGHHLNDQCENFFLSIKKGQGTLGLSGIQKYKIFNNNLTIVRPLLKYEKNELKKWAILKNINWIEDNSNKNNKYDRNFIRNNIIRPITKRWPFFRKNCARSMYLCHIQEISLNFFLDQIICQKKTLNNPLNIKYLQLYIQELQTLLIRRWIFLYTKHVISYKITQSICNNVIYNKNKNTIKTITIQNYKILKYKNLIFQMNSYNSLCNLRLFWYDYNCPLKLPQNLGYLVQNSSGIKIPYPQKNMLVNIRFRTKKYIHFGKFHQIRIKNIWQENKIYPWDRNRIPLLFYDNELIAIIGILVLPFSKKYDKFWKISWINFY